MNYIFSSGAACFLDQAHKNRRFFIIDDEEHARTAARQLRELFRAQTLNLWALAGAQTPAYSGPPPVIPIPRRVPELAPDEVPRVVAKARAVAIFGPKRGRWK